MMADSSSYIPDRPPKPQFGDAQNLQYFHPHLTSLDEVRRAMLPHIEQNGSFLLRISTSREKTYTVSVVHNHSIKHFKVLRKNTQFYLQDRLFSSIDELIVYYNVYEVPNLEGVRSVRLLYPIRNTEREFQSRDRGSSLSSHHSMRGNSNGSFSSFSSVDEMDEDPSAAYNRLFLDEHHSGRRQLPPPPGRRRTESDRRPTTNYEYRGQRGRIRSENLDERPPAPIPVDDTEHSSSSSNGIYNGVYYSCVTRSDVNKLPELLAALKVNQSMDSQFCECGLDLELSQLPQGWSIHISREADAGFGRPFFMSPSQTTSWDLPKEVYLDLDRRQQKFIKWLCDNFEKGNPPPDENTQIQWSSTSSSDSMPDASNLGTSTGGASSGNRDSTGSNTGAASQSGGFTSRGIKDAGDASGANGAASGMVGQEQAANLPL